MSFEYNEDDETYMSGNQIMKQLNLLNEDGQLYHLKRNISPYSSKKTTIDIYGSGGIGSSIRDAITGKKNYMHKVGTKDEDLYFKIRICSGELPSNAPSFFFDSPEHCERHMNKALSNKTKQVWHTKNQEAVKLLHKSN